MQQSALRAWVPCSYAWNSSNPIDKLTISIIVEKKFAFSFSKDHQAHWSPLRLIYYPHNHNHIIKSCVMLPKISYRYILAGCLDSLGPSDAIWRCRSGSTSSHVMLVAWRHQAITWTNVHLSSIHMRAPWHWTPWPLITNITLKITYLNCSFKSLRGQWVNTISVLQRQIFWYQCRACIIPATWNWPSPCRAL